MVEKNTFTPYEAVRILESMNKLLFQMRVMPVSDFECFLSLMPVESYQSSMADKNLF